MSGGREDRRPARCCRAAGPYFRIIKVLIVVAAIQAAALVVLWFTRAVRSTPAH